MQLLHCLRAAPPACGGESMLVDGLTVAHELRRRNPEAYDALATLPVCWADVIPAARTTALEMSCGWDLRTERTVIREQEGVPVEVNYNNGVRASELNLTADEVRRLYAGLRAFGEVAHSDGLMLEMSLGDGEALIFSNRRVLHGRRSIERVVPRWLRGLYIELDEVHSRRRVLRAAQA